jgi:E3 ubiquitin-protein ligase MYCBP2
MGQKGDDYCAICYVEALDSSPSVRSVCGHIFHQKCLAKRFEIRWIGPRILFNFCVCPLCKKWIQLP